MRRALIAAALAVLVLSGCSTTDVAPTAHVSFDTASLRALKQQAGVQPCVAPTASKVTDGLPDVTLPCLGGGASVSMSRLRGPMVVNLFAQSCGPCRLELPYYQAFSKRYAGKVGVLGVDWRDSLPARALGLVKATGVTYPLVADLDGHNYGGGVLALPQIVLIDKNGSVAYAAAESISSERELESLVAKHLGIRL